MPGLTVALVAEEAGQFALAALLLVIGQQLVDELPDQLFGWSVQHWKHVHDQRVHVPAYTYTPSLYEPCLLLTSTHWKDSVYVRCICSDMYSSDMRYWERAIRRWEDNKDVTYGMIYVTGCTLLCIYR